MARTDDDHDGAAVPEADRLAQQEQADTGVVEDTSWPTPATPEVDEGDLLEQAHEVLADPDEEYAPDQP